MFNRINWQALSTSLHKAGIHEKVAAAQTLQSVSQSLQEIFGKEIAKSAKPLYIKNKSLFIKIESSAAAYEIKKKEKEIIQAAQKAGCYNLRRIIFIT